HKTAIVFIVFYPLYYFGKFGFPKVYYGIYVLLSFIFITSILYIASASEANIYVSQGEISSSGAIFRSMFHVFPVFLYLYFRDFFKNEYHKSLLILDYMMLLVLYCIALSFVFSTLSDRFNLYLMFFDIIVYTKLCEKLSLFGRNILFFYLFSFFSITFYIWFEFGEWADYGWIPYQNYIVNYLSNVF
ncbi:EpsG family protein, partial [Acinetobacter bereziniae]